MQNLGWLVAQNGNVHLLESIKLSALRRALVTILEEEPATSASETALLREQAPAEDWMRPEEDEAWSHLQLAR